MRSINLAFALGSLLVLGSAVCAQDQAQVIVENAIQAQGGEANIGKLRTMRVKVKGATNLVPGQPDLPFTVEDTWQMPSRYKSSFTFQLQGREFSQTQVIDGDNGWIVINGQTRDLPADAVAEMKEQKYAEDLDRLGFLEEKGVELSVLDEVQVNGKPAAGILVKSPGHRDVKLYFDKASGLLAKREHQVLDPASGNEVRQEVVFSAYHERDGLKHYQEIAAFRDGEKIFDAKVTETEFFEKLDEDVFAKP